MAKDFTVTRPSPKWVLNKDGVLVQFAEDFPSFEFNSNGTYKGMLVEPRSTNKMFPSIPDNTWNNKQSVSITTNDALAPDGTMTATKINGTTNWYFRKSVSDIDTGTWTISCWVKAVTPGTNDTFRLSVSGNNVSSNLTATGEWQRFEFTFTNGGSTVSGLFKDSSSNFADLYIWGVQVEESPITTSYIKTTSSTETRNEDVITMSDASQYIPSEGAVIMEWEQREADTIYIGALSASVNAGVRKLRFEYSSTEQKLFIDDFETAVDETTGDFDFSGMDEIELGHINGANQPNTHIRYFAIV